MSVRTVSSIFILRKDWFLFFLLFFYAIAPSPAVASTADPSSLVIVENSVLAIPPEYGRVIYSKNGQAKNQIYIIGQSHRSSGTGRNGGHTVQAQVEIYRIGESLIRQKQVGLLLPEGFFERGSAEKKSKELRPPLQIFDDEGLREKLTDTRTLTNADRLLNASYPLHLGQVENEELYGHVAAFLRKLGSPKRQLDSNFFIRLNHFQEKRTAAILQKVPGVIDREFLCGNIASKKAIMTIGLAHVAEIIRFLQLESTELSTSIEGVDRVEPCELALLQEDYGITVILPRTLAEDEKAMRLTRLLDYSSEN